MMNDEMMNDELMTNDQYYEMNRILVCEFIQYIDTWSIWTVFHHNFNNNNDNDNNYNDNNY